MRATGLPDSEEYRQFEQVIEEATGEAITAFQPYALGASPSQVGKMRVYGPALANGEPNEEHCCAGPKWESVEHIVTRFSKNGMSISWR
jgi:hypothetical protein